jgi:two-component system sensor histidine kinase SenX3
VFIPSPSARRIDVALSRRTDQGRLRAALDALADRTGSGDRTGGGVATDVGAPDVRGTEVRGRDVGDLGLLELAAGAAEQAHASLRDADSEVARLRAALDLVSEGVVVCDERGIELYRNSKAMTLAGARLGDVVAARAIDDALALALTGERAEQVLELFSPTRRNLVIRARPVFDDEGLFGAVAIVEDVSERRRLEAIRRDFVANVSHELKTPVGALSLLAETLDGEEDPDVVARLAARVSTEAARLGRIIDDLLDLSRIEANDMPLREANPLHLLVHQAVDPVRPVADSRHIKIDVTEASADVVVQGDRRDLVSAIGNLVENAVKYSEDHSLVRVRSEIDQTWITISVCDEGDGIPRKELERIFERFYRVDRARSRLTGGTGLGLSIVRHVAANHGGHVDVESEEGVGSTFRLRLPVAPVRSEDVGG